MSFVGIPQACESIAIDLEKLGATLRQYAQARRRPDLDSANHDKNVRARMKSATNQLNELLQLMDAELANLRMHESKEKPDAST